MSERVEKVLKMRSEEEKYQEKKRMEVDIKRLYQQMISGCGDAKCKNLG